MLTRRSFLEGTSAALFAVGACGSLVGCAQGSGENLSGSNESTTNSDSTESEIQSTTLFLFDTVVSIEAQCSADLMDAVVERCEFFENTFSRTIEGSDIWNINNAHGEAVQVKRETADCILAGIVYAQETGGLFDITIGAVSELWDFDEGIKPDNAAIQEAVVHVGYQNISVDGTTVTLADPDAKLDLGGIAKGFIADDLVTLLREGGCENASISLGGNVYVMGKSFDGDDWNVGVRNPSGESTEVVARAQASNKSFVTSGLYERYFEQDGMLYYHILDPQTGYPAQTDLVSVSVASDSSLEGDVYSTTLFLLGREKALSLLDSDDRFEGVLIDSEGNVLQSNGNLFDLSE